MPGWAFRLPCRQAGRRADACEKFRRNKRLHVVYDAGLEGACGERGAAFDEYAVDAAFSKGGHKLPQIDASVVLGTRTFRSLSPRALRRARLMRWERTR